MNRTIAVISLLFAVSAHGDTRSGLDALGRGDYSTALEEFRPQAETGDLSAQGFLAHTYKQMENYREAYAWFHAAAQCGSLDARLERRILEGKMTPSRIDQAKKLGDTYYEKYCEQ